jgi:hypothetical protein
MIEAVSVPEGSAGKWAVRRFTVGEQEASMTRLSAMKYGRGYVPPGTYTELRHGGRLIMSDTPDERRDHYPPVVEAKGHILINGLGIGMVLAACLKRPAVTRATVVEIDPDVIALVAPHYDDPRVEVINADAFEYRPPKGIRYGMVWHDIWPDICGDNLPEMTRLKRKYGKRADWQGCWCESQCRRGR